MGMANAIMDAMAKMGTQQASKGITPTSNIQSAMASRGSPFKGVGKKQNDSDVYTPQKRHKSAFSSPYGLSQQADIARKTLLGQ